MRGRTTQKSIHVQWRDERRLATIWEPASGRTGSVFVVAPPFAEELNRSRRTLALSGRTLAGAGHTMILVDLYGCGDSPGEFGDATWRVWCDDIQETASWAAKHFRCAPALLTVRAGSLFLPDVGHMFERFVLWQPVLEGEKYLRQVLRLKVTRDKLSGAQSSIGDLWEQLTRGEQLEVAGYTLSPDLVLPMARRSLSDWSPHLHEILWLETGNETQGDLGPASLSVVRELETRGIDVICRWVQGPQFWNTIEISESTALAGATLDMLSGNGS